MIKKDSDSTNYIITMPWNLVPTVLNKRTLFSTTFRRALREHSALWYYLADITVRRIGDQLQLSIAKYERRRGALPSEPLVNLLSGGYETWNDTETLRAHYQRAQDALSAWRQELAKNRKCEPDYITFAEHFRLPPLTEHKCFLRCLPAYGHPPRLVIIWGTHLSP
jgi:hypothetical protein